MDSKKLAKLACDALAEKKADDIKVIDIENISIIADYFVLASGDNQNQLQAMRDAVEESLYKAGAQLKQVEGNAQSTWILMDYGTIVVHIFSEEDRSFYDLERIWRDGIILDAAEL